MEQQAFYITDAKKLKSETDCPHKAHNFAKTLAAKYAQMQKLLPPEKAKPLDNGEYWSWVYSLPHFADLLLDAGLDEGNSVILEGVLQIRTSIKRIDAILCGQETDNIPSVMLWELKRWNDSNGFSVAFGRDDEPPATVKIMQHGNFYRNEEHPSVKVGKCRSVIHYRLKGLLDETHPQIGARAFAYYDQQTTNFPQPWRYVLRARRYTQLVKGSFPEMITRNNTAGVTDAISKFIGKGGGSTIHDALIEGGILGFDETALRSIRQSD